MKILCSIHLYPPKHNCGAEFMQHGINKFLKSKGHEVRVLLWQANQYKIDRVYEFEGIEVFPPNQKIAETLFDWADVVITYLDMTENTIGLAHIFKKPVVHICHNSYERASIRQAHRKQYVVYNSEWVKKELNYQHESMVMHPPCDWRKYDTGKDSEKNEYITLINIDQNKGGEILREIAKRMPDKKFLGVKGSYSEPASIGQITDQPSNVKVIENTSNIIPVYEQTRVLIMPSKYESYGRTSIEAMCSGIPVISSGTPGLREACGDAGIYIEREDIDGWVKAIKKLDDPVKYKKQSKICRDRSRELDPEKELSQFESWLKTIR
jgi:glycosyltransferase involved in cell wall biosynthesis